MSAKTVFDSELFREWNYPRNGSLDPKAFKLGSNKKVWWRCCKGHEWEAVVCSRSAGGGCPYCANKRINSENNLAARFPELAKEWDAKKNKVMPTQVFPGTIKKYWWVCKNGHSYEASPNHRTSSNRGCPYCSGRKVSHGNSLLVNFPEIASEFDVEKNVAQGIALESLTIKSQKKVWWKCKKGHQWKTSVSNRTRGTRCPFCNSQVSRNELRVYAELKSLFEGVCLKKKVHGLECDIFIPKLNVGVEYDGVYWHKDKQAKDREKGEKLLRNGINLVRIREKGLGKLSDNDVLFNHEEESIITAIKDVLRILVGNHWVAFEDVSKYLRVNNFVNDEEYRVLLERLPSPIVEDSLAFKFPELLQEWDDTRNKGLTPKDVSAKSTLKVWWKCRKGHVWESTIGNRTQGGNGCPYCAHQFITKEASLAYKRPDLIPQWDLERNLGVSPSDVFAYTTKKYWWKCSLGHSWLASPSNRAAYGRGKNTGCPYCSPTKKRASAGYNLAVTHGKLAAEWGKKRNGLLTPTMVTRGSSKKVWWECVKGHEWEATISSRVRGNGCPYCSNQKVSLESSLYSVCPDLSREWNIEKNKALTPKDVTPGTRRKVWWRCKNGHEWEASVGQRSNLKSGCPYCSGYKTTIENSLAVKYPEMAREWNAKRNGELIPTAVSQKSSKSVWWICRHGHEWMAPVKARVAGRYKCPKCRGKNSI